MFNSLLTIPGVSYYQKTRQELLKKLNIKETVACII